MEAKAKSCYKCGQEGHIVGASPLNIPNPLRPFEQSRDCPDTTSGGNSGFSAGSGSECYRCGKVGHIARSCTESGNNSGSYGGGFGGGAQKTWSTAVAALATCRATASRAPSATTATASVTLAATALKLRSALATPAAMK
ncbi:hypothetical protein H0H81_006389, partial [Sphagnurus paluster]